MLSEVLKAKDIAIVFDGENTRLEIDDQAIPLRSPTLNKGEKINMKTKQNRKDVLQLVVHSKDTTELKNYTTGKTVAVKRFAKDEYDKEKAVLYLIAKMHGYTPNAISKLIKNAVFTHGFVKDKLHECEDYYLKSKEEMKRVYKD